MFKIRSLHTDFPFISFLQREITQICFPIIKWNNLYLSMIYKMVVFILNTNTFYCKLLTLHCIFKQQSTTIIEIKLFWIVFRFTSSVFCHYNRKSVYIVIRNRNIGLVSVTLDYRYSNNYPNKLWIENNDENELCRLVIQK